MNIVTAFQQIRAHFTVHTHQKTAQQIREIDTDRNVILIEDWGWRKGFFTVDISKAGWPEDVPCMEKDFFPWEIEEYCRESFDGITYFQEWWGSLLTSSQRIIVEDFIRVHNGTLQNELDVYYNRQTGKVWKL